ncbi:MAG: adenosine deaminase, partial [Cohaesibacteraceae bacterium]
TLEVSTQTNIDLKAVPSAAEHTAKTLLDAGIKLPANSDDPPHFANTLAKDVETMVSLLGGAETEIRAMLTRNALEAAFVDEQTRAKLIAKLDAAVDSA